MITRQLRLDPSDKEAQERLRRDLMEILRGHFRPEFLNRIDEIIVFHSLTREQLRDIVDLQLERVKRTAHGQGVDLEFDATLIDHLALVGYQPEYGARELRRLIRSEIETELARAMLAGEVQEGDRVTVRRDGNEQKVTFERRPKPQRVVEKKPPAPSTSVAREQAEPLAAQGASLTRKPSQRQAGSHRPRKAS